MRMRFSRRHRQLALALIATAPLATAAGAETLTALPPVPVPAENPLTEPKRILGKILFWDEQLSSDDSIACGSCHRPAAGGADPRSAVHPGNQAGSFDDVRGSPGIRRLDRNRQPETDPVFGDGPQVTPRTAPAVMGALWAEAIFWDGRASGALVDPDTGATVIAAGAALENQVLETLLNPAEMSHPGRGFAEIGDKLAAVRPLALADRYPPDIAAALTDGASYPELFAAAFGDPQVSAGRIAMAIASYERTLVPDRTPWDRFIAGDDTALAPNERFGWEAMQTLKCTGCHVPPLFGSSDFANIGLRRSEFDPGRAAVTGAAEDAGEMRIPSLRNVGLRPRLMHTGEFASVAEAVAFYRNPVALPDVDQLPGGGAYNFGITQIDAADIQAFLARSLTDPRVAAETFPFDRPRLNSER